VPNILIGKDSFQEVDITGMTLSITKHNYLVRNVKDLAKTIREAMEVAVSGRPGPVLVDIPKDLFYAEYEYEPTDEVVYKEEIVFPEDALIERAAEFINKSKKPVLYAGGGVRISKNDKLLVKLAEMAEIPVANSFMGFGTIPREHELSLGLVGMHGQIHTNMAVTNSDLVIAIGARFSDRVIGKPDEFAPNAKIIHIDIDSTEVDKNTQNCVPLIGDMEYILKNLIERVNKTKRPEWIEEIDSFREEEPDKTLFTPRNILEKTNEYFQDNTIVATDVGQHQMWTGQYWKFKKSEEFCTSGGLGTMGYGLGAAIGAKVGNPDKDVLLVTGDASFRMNNNELITVKRYNLPIRMLQLNNHSLGMVRQWQRMFSEARYSETDTFDDVNMKMFIESYGIKYFLCHNLEELDRALDETKDLNEAVFFECIIDKDASVYPIVPPGRPINELLING
jgi:acetolactate synthase-1/2/3 large subunit